MTKIKWYVVLCLIGLISQSQAQEFDQDSLADPNLEQARGMVETMAYYFNLLGGNRASITEKETIINSSYLKLFANEKVQVEDDLQEGRSTVIYKDIQAYLKDIDFFFEQVYFDFDIDTVEQLTKADNTPYYRVELIRNLEGVSLSGDSVNTTKKRFVELNIDTKNELKIVSIYTTKVSKEKQLRAWWEALTLEWKRVFQPRIGHLRDSLTTDELLSLVTIDSLDISGNELILDLEPLYQLTSLKHLKVSNTWINDLSPLLSINKLKSLNISNTSVHDLQFLKYHKDIQKLNLSKTHVQDFSPLRNFDKLKELNLNGFSMADLSFISELTSLEILYLENAKGVDHVNFEKLRQLKHLYLQDSDLSSLQGISGLSQLTNLDVSGTQLSNLNGFEQLQKLHTLRIDNTRIEEVDALATLPGLKLLYANGTNLSEEQIKAFNSRSKAYLITDSDQLKKWWEELPEALKSRLRKIMGTASPGVEELTALMRIDSLDASQTGLRSTQPLARFQSLKYLNLEQNSISDLEGQYLSPQIVTLTINSTNLSRLSGLSNLKNLETLEARKTNLQDISAVTNLYHLKILDVDGSNITEAQVAAVLDKRPITVRFKSAELLDWWARLDGSLKKSFTENAGLSSNPDKDELHRLIALEALVFKGITPDESLEKSLGHFYKLKSLTFQRAGISSIQDLPAVPGLERLAVLQVPIQSLEGLGEKYPDLKQLDITNTAVEDLRPLSALPKLEYLNCSGTNVKRFRGLEYLTHMIEIDCSNTKVFRLDRLSNLSKLQKLTCFNTGLRQNDIDKLLESLPDLEVVYY